MHIRPGKAPRDTWRDLGSNVECADAERLYHRTRGFTAGYDKAPEAALAGPDRTLGEGPFDQCAGALGAQLSCAARTAAGVAVA